MALSLISCALFARGCGPDSRLHLRGVQNREKEDRYVWNSSIVSSLKRNHVNKIESWMEKTKLVCSIKMFLRETVFGGPGESGGSRGDGTARRLPLLVGLADLRRAPRRLRAHTYRFLSTIIPLSAPAAIAARDRTTGEDGRSVSVGCEAFTPARPPHRT